MSVTLTLIEKDRDYEQVDASLLKGIIRTFSDLSTDSLPIYVNDFERELLHTTREYYLAESTTFIDSGNDFCDYMKLVSKRIKEEEKRAVKFLDPTTRDKLLSECDNVLISHHRQHFYDNFRDLVYDDQLKVYILLY